jgi:WD40 repeat protein
MQAFQDVFISYGRRDSLTFATELNHRLGDRLSTVWFDYEDIPRAVKYQIQINDGIDRADNFLFIISPHSVNSDYCRLEIDRALAGGKRIIPILHVERISHELWQQRNPNGTDADWEKYQAAGRHDHFQNMHPVIQELNWIFAREGIDNFEAALADVLKVCDRHKTYVHQHTQVWVKALEWKQHDKRSSYLLIGEERLAAEAWLKQRFTDSQPPCVVTDLHCEFISESRKNAENLMTDVFLIDDEADQSTAEKICRSLRREGFTVWTKTANIPAGAAAEQASKQGLEEADNVVYLLSAAAVRSPQCQRELEYALSLHKRVIPIRVEVIESEQLPMGLRNLQFIDLTDNLQETDYLKDESELLRALRQDATYHTDHKIFLAKALKWERQQKNPTLLLRGYNLRYAENWLKIAQQHPFHRSTALQEFFIAESLRQPSGVLVDVFISYSRADSGFARKLNDRLQMQDKRTWFDQESIAAGTADFQQEIERGIASADTFLFILSPRSINSPYCASEVEYAARLNKRFVTILRQAIKSDRLHPELAKVQWLDWTQGTEEEFSTNLTKLLAILNTDSEHLHTHTRLLQRAIEWSEAGRKDSLLLRGDRLEQAEQWLVAAAAKQPEPSELHRSYIRTSREAEDTQQRNTRVLEEAAARGEAAKQKLQEAESKLEDANKSAQEATAKGQRRLLMGTAAGAIGLLIAAFSGIAFYRADTQIRVADVRVKMAASQEQFLSEQPFRALLKALEAGQALKQIPSGSAERQELQSRVMGVLQQAINHVREKNTLDEHQSLPTSASFSPDGKMLASSSSDKKIKLWNVGSGKSVRTLSGHQEWVRHVSFSPDGKTLVSASGDKTIKLWDIASGKALFTFEGHQGEVTHVSFSPDGKTLASASDDKTIKLWDIASGKALLTLNEQGMVRSVSFSPDGKTLVSNDRNTVKLWEIASGKLVRTLPVGDSYSWVGNVSFSLDGKTLVSAGSDKTIKLWDVASGKTIDTLSGHQSWIYDVSFSPDGKTLATASDDKTIMLWDVASRQKILTLHGHQAWVGSVSFSPDGKTLVSTSRDDTIKLWDIASAMTVRTLGGKQNETFDVSFSPDGKILASSGKDEKLWDIASGKEIRSLKGHRDLGISLSFSRDGKTLATASYDSTIRIWDVASGKEVRKFQGSRGDWMYNIRLSPDGKTLAAASRDKTLKLWDVASGKEVWTLRGRYTDVSFSPDGKTLAAGNPEQSIKLWDTASGKEVQTLSQRWVDTVRFSPDGKILAASGNRLIKLWDLASGKELHTIKGHREQINQIEFSPDGKTLASTGVDRTIKLWDVASGQELHTIAGHQGRFVSISFSPDGKTIATSDNEGPIRLWVWDFDRLMTMGCDWLREYLDTRPDQRSLCEGYLPAKQ